MSGPTITMGPTMVNPEAMNTVAELRQELHRANEQLLRFSERLHAMNTVAHQMGDQLGYLVARHMQGKADEVTARLDQLAQYVRPAHATSGEVH